MNRTLSQSRIAAVVVCALVAFVVTVSSRADATVHVTTPRTSVSACAPSNVVNWLNTTADGTAGSVYYEIQFTNVSSKKCSLFGFPGVSAVNASAHQVGAAAGRMSGTGHTVDLAPRESVEASLQVTETGDFTTRACEPQTARGLRVFAPSATTSDVIPFPFSTCSNSHTVSLHVGPVRIG